MRLLQTLFAALFLAACTHAEPVKPADVSPNVLTFQFCHTPDCAITQRGMPYKIYADDDLVAEGVVDETGQVYVEHKPTTRKYRAIMSNGTEYVIPVKTNASPANTANDSKK